MYRLLYFTIEARENEFIGKHIKVILDMNTIKFNLL